MKFDKLGAIDVSKLPPKKRLRWLLEAQSKESAQASDTATSESVEEVRSHGGVGLTRPGAANGVDSDAQVSVVSNEVQAKDHASQQTTTTAYSTQPVATDPLPDAADKQPVASSPMMALDNSSTSTQQQYTVVPQQPTTKSTPPQQQSTTISQQSTTPPQQPNTTPQQPNTTPQQPTSVAEPQPTTRKDNLPAAGAASNKPHPESAPTNKTENCGKPPSQTSSDPPGNLSETHANAGVSPGTAKDEATQGGPSDPKVGGGDIKPAHIDAPKSPHSDAPKSTHNNAPKPPPETKTALPLDGKVTKPPASEDASGPPKSHEKPQPITITAPKTDNASTEKTTDELIAERRKRKEHRKKVKREKRAREEQSAAAADAAARKAADGSDPDDRIARETTQPPDADVKQERATGDMSSDPLSHTKKHKKKKKKRRRSEVDHDGQPMVGNDKTKDGKLDGVAPSHRALPKVGGQLRDQEAKKEEGPSKRPKASRTPEKVVRQPDSNDTAATREDQRGEKFKSRDEKPKPLDDQRAEKSKPPDDAKSKPLEDLKPNSLDDQLGKKPQSPDHNDDDDGEEEFKTPKKMKLEQASDRTMSSPDAKKRIKLSTPDRPTPKKSPRTTVAATTNKADIEPADDPLGLDEREGAVGRRVFVKLRDQVLKEDRWFCGIVEMYNATTHRHLVVFDESLEQCSLEYSGPCAGALPTPGAVGTTGAGAAQGTPSDGDSDVQRLERLSKFMDAAFPNLEVLTNTDDALRVLRKLARSKVTAQSIQSTGVGLKIGRLRKHPNQEVSGFAKKVIKSWKQQMQQQDKLAQMLPFYTLVLSEKAKKNPKRASRYASVYQYSGKASTEKLPDGQASCHALIQPWPSCDPGPLKSNLMWSMWIDIDAALVGDRIVATKDEELYCICRRPESSITPSGHCPDMILCQLCGEWYHFRCIGISEDFDLPQGWKCEFCLELPRTAGESEMGDTVGTQVSLGGQVSLAPSFHLRRNKFVKRRLRRWTCHRRLPLPAALRSPMGWGYVGKPVELDKERFQRVVSSWGVGLNHMRYQCALNSLKSASMSRASITQDLESVMLGPTLKVSATTTVFRQLLNGAQDKAVRKVGFHMNKQIVEWVKTHAQSFAPRPEAQSSLALGEPGQPKNTSPSGDKQAPKQRAVVAVKRNAKKVRKNESHDPTRVYGIADPKRSNDKDVCIRSPTGGSLYVEANTSWNVIANDGSQGTVLSRQWLSKPFLRNFPESMMSCARVRSRGDKDYRQSVRMKHFSAGWHGGSSKANSIASVARPDDNQTNTSTDDAIRAAASKDRAQRLSSRQVALALDKSTGDSAMSTFHQLTIGRKKRLRFGRSKIHAWGVFAEEHLAPGDLVIEYKGELIRPIIADLREKRYEEQNIPDYMFRIDNETICDATVKGSLARFINHSCDPNCYTQIISHQGVKKIVIYAKTSIASGEELTYDYKFPIEEDKINCNCGAERCRGTMN